MKRKKSRQEMETKLERCKDGRERKHARQTRKKDQKMEKINATNTEVKPIKQTKQSISEPLSISDLKERVKERIGSLNKNKRQVK